MADRVVMGASALRLLVPLTSPYRWRGGVVEHFDTVLALVTDDDGRTGVGEGTAVAGYSFETPDDVWASVALWLQRLPGRPVPELLTETAQAARRAPFAVAALRGALEHLAGHLEPPRHVPAIPVVGTVRAEDPSGEVDTARRLVEAGYRTLKLKVGNDLDGDLGRVAALQRYVHGARLRLDANQGFGFAEAARFLDRLEPTGIELVEQPLSAAAWDDQRRLHAGSPIPLMLDEAIWTDEDVRRASECADVVKLKVMKSGGADLAHTQARLAQSLGLDVVIGNGVATEVDAFAEAVVHARAGLTTAAEFNGFDKQVVSPVRKPFSLVRGCLDLSACDPPQLDPAVVDRLCVERREAR